VSFELAIRAADDGRAVEGAVEDRLGHCRLRVTCGGEQQAVEPDVIEGAVHIVCVELG